MDGWINPKATNQSKQAIMMTTSGTHRHFLRTSLLLNLLLCFNLLISTCQSFEQKSVEEVKQMILDKNFPIDGGYGYCVIMLPTYVGYGSSQKLSTSTYMGQIHRQCFSVPTYNYLKLGVSSSDDEEEEEEDEKEGKGKDGKKNVLGVQPHMQLMHDTVNLLKFIRSFKHTDTRMLEIVKKGELMVDNICSWHNVLCSTIYETNSLHYRHGAQSFNDRIGHKVIAGFRCRGCNITGDLHEAISDVFLPYLQVLDLSHNQLTGKFPEDIFYNMPLVRELVLNNNHLKGEFPKDSNTYNDDDELVEEILDINNAIFSALGTKDMDDIYELTNHDHDIDFSLINSLLVRRHDILSKNIQNGKNAVVRLDLSNNNFTRIIPRQMLKLSGMEHLNLQGNRLSGNLPLNIYLPMTKYLSLADNNLSGKFSFGDEIVVLEHLDLSNNNFSGELPDVCPFPYLWHLNITGNTFIGKVHDWIGEKLNEVGLGDNRLTSHSLSLCPRKSFAPESQSGPWEACSPCENGPSYVGQSSCFGVPYVNDTSLALEIMDERKSSEEIIWYLFDEMGIPHNRQVDICQYHGIKCSNEVIVSLDLTARQICPIPSILGQLNSLEYLRLRGLTGTLPRELGRLENLKIVSIFHNKLEGTIPPALFSKWSSIRQIDLSFNGLSGPLPTNLSAMINSLEFLNVGNNNLNGTIPFNLNSLSNLKELHFNNNQFTGTLPSFKGLKKLSVVDFGNNHLSGDIPIIVNDPTHYMHLKEILLNDNSFTGTIPSSLSALPLLSTLNLSRNNFTGTVARGISTIPSLLKINLSSNKLTGKIPELFGINNNMISLLDLTDNYFTGTVPVHLCENTRINMGAAIRYHCNGIVCPVGTYNEEFGYGSCSPCKNGSEDEYLGRKSCLCDEAYYEKNPIDIDLEHLKDVYNFLRKSDEWSEEYDNSWFRGKNKCFWYGVKCNEEGRVVGLTLPIS